MTEDLTSTAELGRYEDGENTRLERRTYAQHGIAGASPRQSRNEVCNTERE